MAMAGLREVLVHAENEHRVVTATTSNKTITGKVLRVNPLILESSDGSGIVVIDFDAIQTICIQGASAEEVVNACKPQTETRFTSPRKF